MKTILNSVLLTATALCCTALLSCNKFDDVQDGDVNYFGKNKTFAEEINGQLYWFIPESNGSQNVLVTWNRINYNSIVDYIRYTSKYTGAVDVPSTVTHNGVTYTVTGADDNAFYYCTDITSLKLQEGMTHWGEHTWFYSPYRNVMTKVTEIYLPSTLSDLPTIPAYYFRGNTALVNCHIPNVTEIGEGAFWGCTKLTTLNLPASATETEGIYIPASVTKIGANAFALCNSRAYLTVEAGNTVYTSQDGSGVECNAIIERSSGKLILGCKNTTLPSGVTGYSSFAFSGVYTTKNTTLQVPASVTTVEPGAFAGCTGLSDFSVAADNNAYDSRDNCNAIIETSSNKLVAGCNYTTIPESVRSIGNYAFYGFSMSTMTLSEGVEAIGEYAFANCSSMKTLTLPSTMKNIGNNAFNGTGKLVAIYVNATTPPAIANATTFSNASKCKVYVPAGTKEAYEKDTFWGAFSSIIEITEE